MNQVTIILIHTGSGKLPSQLLETLIIVKKIAKNSRILFLANQINHDAFQNANSSSDINCGEIEFVSVESIPSSDASKRFRQNSTLDQSFRSGFWFNASYRFLLLADYLEFSGVTDVIHIENDYVLYFDPTDKINALRSFSDFAVPLDRVRAIPGIVWIKNESVAKNLAIFMASNPRVDDMDSLGQFCMENVHTFAKPFPTIPHKYAVDKGLDVNLFSQGIELFGGIFDAAAVGQYVGGVHWMNNVNDTTFFINESSDLNLDDFIFSWNVRNGIKIPSITYQNNKTNILGIHAHSKNLEEVSPFNHGVPQIEDVVVTGERIQAFCDLTLSTPSITKFHGRENIETNLLVEFQEDKSGQLLPPNLDMIEKIRGSKVIFVYTHLIPYFNYYIAPRLRKPFILVTHNSDHSVSIVDYQLLNHSYLLAWFSQNCEFNHAKLIPLPIGVQNKQWGAANIKKLVEVGKRIDKEKLLYVNFSNSTHHSRGIAMSVAKSVTGATIETDVPYETYLKNLSKHKFCLCPRGNGIDTHRFWEAQYLDVIPIIISSDWTSSYSELPILILENWESLLELDLEKLYIIISNKKYSRKNLNLSEIGKFFLSC